MLSEIHCFSVREANDNSTDYNCDSQPGEKRKENNSLSFGTQNAKIIYVYSQLNEIKAEAQAQKVKMIMTLSLNGKIVSKPQITTKLNSMASISQKSDWSQKELLIEVLPSLQNINDQEVILMKFKIGHKENGQIKWFSSPQILTENNQEAEIVVQTNNPNDEYNDIYLKVLPVLQ